MDRATRQALRSFPPAMWVVVSGNFVNRFGGFVAPLLVLHVTRLGYSKTQAGLVLAAYGLGKLGSAFAGGAWTDRHGHRFVIVTSMFSSAAMMLVMSTLTDYRPLLGATLLLGFASELFRPATQALIAELAPPENRITAFALNRLAVNAGFAFGPALGGWLAHGSFFWVFAGNALTEMIYGVLAWRALPQRIGGAAGLHYSATPPGNWRDVFGDRRLLLFLASIFPMTFIFMQATSSFALYTADCGLSSGEYGLLLSCNGVLIVVGELSLTSLTRRFAPAPVLMLGYLLLGVGFALGGFAHAFWPLAGTVVLWTLGEMVSAPTQGAVLANMAPDHLRGRYMAASGFLWSAATIVGPWLGTTLYAWSPPALWWTAAGAGLASAAAVRYSLRLVPARPCVLAAAP